MKSILIATVFIVAGCTQLPQPAAVGTAQAQGGASNVSEVQKVNDEFVKRVAERIAGRENDPADQVFRNIQIPWLKTIPAGRFLRIMNGGYSRALGVTCTHCHVEADFASDDKRPKLAAREMAVMHRMINQQLATMQNLETASDKRAINCATCHRGAIIPSRQ